MGVKACHRKGCSEIMCDTYINETGYICNDCQKEFKENLSSSNQNPETEGSILKLLKPFMETEKEEYSKKEISVNDFFRENTR